MVRDWLDSQLEQRPALAGLADAIGRAGGPPPATVEAVRGAQDAFAAWAGLPPPCKPGFWANAVRYLQEWASDPDTDVPGWLASGAPIGVAAPFSCRGIFPKAADAGEAVEECELLGGFGEAPNYKSAEEAHEAVRAELEREEAEGYITGYPSRQDAEIAAGGPIVQK